MSSAAQRSAPVYHCSEACRSETCSITLHSRSRTWQGMGKHSAHSEPVLSDSAGGNASQPASPASQPASQLGGAPFHQPIVTFCPTAHSQALNTPPVQYAPALACTSVSWTVQSASSRTVQSETV